MTPTVAEPATLTEQKDPYRFGWRMVLQKNEQGQMEYVQVPLKYEDLLHPEEEDFIVHIASHDIECFYLQGALQLAVNDRSGVEVLHDVRIDWGVEGLKAHGPDLVVFVDVNKPWVKEKGTFKVAEVGARPVLVIEVASPSTRTFDLDDKVVHYHKAGVPFYVIVDYRPELDERVVHLLGYTSTPRGYVRVAPDSQGRLWLDAVKLWIAAEGDHAVCFYEDGTRVPQIRELNRALRQQESRAEELQHITEEAITARQEAEKQRKLAEEKLAEEAKQKKLAEEANAALALRMAELETELRRMRGE